MQFWILLVKLRFNLKGFCLLWDLLSWLFVKLSWLFVKQNWCVLVSGHFVFKMDFGNKHRISEHVPTFKRRNIGMCKDKGKGIPVLN